MLVEARGTQINESGSKGRGGQSSSGKELMPVDVLSELVNESREKILETSERLTTLTAELEQDNETMEEMKSELSRIRAWSEIFDDSDMEVKKMIANYIIKWVNVSKGYELDIELNLNIQQFLNGLDHDKDCAVS